MLADFIEIVLLSLGGFFFLYSAAKIVAAGWSKGRDDYLKHKNQKDS
jgi:hypothetical protein